MSQIPGYPRFCQRNLVTSLCLLSLATVGIGAWQMPALAEGAGFVITGSEEVPVLKYKLDFNGVRNRLDRYRLDIPAQDVAVAEIVVSGEPNFDGKVDPNEVRLEVEGKAVELASVYWDEQFRSLEVVAKEPIASGQKMRLVLSNVRNPSNPSDYRFTGRVLGTEANPLFRTVGNWIISIDLAERKPNAGQ